MKKAIAASAVILVICVAAILPYRQGKSQWSEYCLRFKSVPIGLTPSRCYSFFWAN